MTNQLTPSPLNRRYFWDVDPSKLDPQQRSTFIIERLLEEGDRQAFHWLEAMYSSNQVRRVLTSSRRISPRTANFFSLVLDIPKQEFRCLNPSYRKAHAQHWPH